MIDYVPSPAFWHRYEHAEYLKAKADRLQRYADAFSGTGYERLHAHITAPQDIVRMMGHSIDRLPA